MAWGQADGDDRRGQRPGADDRRRRVARAHGGADRRRPRARPREHLVRDGPARRLLPHRGRRRQLDPGQRDRPLRGGPAHDHRGGRARRPRRHARGLRDRRPRPDRHGRDRASARACGRAASAHREIEVINPATEEPVASVPAGSADDVELAVETAKRAFPDWSRTDMEQRAAILAKAADLIHENAKALAGTLTAEQGKPVAEAMGEVNHLAHGVRFYAEAATKVRGAYQALPSALGRSYGMVIRRPMGVCTAITPYNFPLTLLGTKVAPALAGGNTVVAKPAA